MGPPGPIDSKRISPFLLQPPGLLSPPLSQDLLTGNLPDRSGPERHARFPHGPRQYYHRGQPLEGFDGANASMNRLNDSRLSDVQLLLVDFVNRLLHPLGRVSVYLVEFRPDKWHSLRGPRIHFWEKLKWDETAEKHATAIKTAAFSPDDCRFVAQAPGVDGP